MRAATICLVAGLAIVAVVATLVPSTSGVFGWPEIGWAVAPSLWVLNVSIGVLAALSVLVASRDTDGARYLGLLLALLALAAGFGTADEALLPDVLRGLGLGWALAFVIVGVWVRFALHFPRPLTQQDVVITLMRQRVLEVGWDAPKATSAYRASREAFTQRFPRFTALQRRIRAPFLWLQEKQMAAAAKPMMRDEAESEARKALRFVSLMPWLAASGAVGSVLAARTHASWAEPLLYVGVFGLWGTGTQFATIGFTVVDSTRRSKALWVYQGLSFGILLATVVPGTVLVAIWLTGAPVTYLGLPLLVASTAPLYLTACVVIAVFWEGALDPRLAIRRTTVYGALGILFVFLFSASANVVSEFVEGRLGLPGVVGTGLYGGSVTVLLLPLRSWFTKVAERWVPSLDADE